MTRSGISSASTSTPSPARLSATVLLLRDGPAGLEVYVMVRHHQTGFAAGALVFPGGKLTPEDADPCVRTRCSGMDQVPEGQVALRVAAIREAFEECGVLLARSRGSNSPLSPQRVAELGLRYRKPLDRGELGIGQMLEVEDLELVGEALVPFAHWVTPVHLPQRFDTYFYLAAAPTDQLAAHDGSELVDSIWLRPAEALAQADAGSRMLMLPTRANLQRLGAYRSVAEALASARLQPIVTVLPGLVETSEGPRLRIPAEAGYAITDFSPGTPPRKV